LFEQKFHKHKEQGLDIGKSRDAFTNQEQVCHTGCCTALRAASGL